MRQRRPHRFGLFAGMIALVLVANGCGAGQTSALPAPLPRLELAAFKADGDALQLATLKGPAVVTFWAWWCLPCRKELPIFEELYQQGKVDVVGINWQETKPDEADKLIDRTGVTFPLYSDPGGETNGLKPFPPMRGLPFLVLVDGDGEVVHQEFVAIDSLSELEGIVDEHLGEGS